MARKSSRKLFRRKKRRPFHVRHHPFDIGIEIGFKQNLCLRDDAALTAALLKRNQELSPTEKEQKDIEEFMCKIRAVLEEIIKASNVEKDGFLIDTKFVVGSFIKNTMITKKCVGDVVIVLQTLPTFEVRNILAFKIQTLLYQHKKENEIYYTTANDEGFDIHCNNYEAIVRILLATIPINFSKIKNSIHIKLNAIKMHLAAIKHIQWFQESICHPTIKSLVRIMKDFTERFDGLKSLTPWMIDLLVNFAVLETTDFSPLPINLAFRRILQMLSSGIFTPGSSGFIDPCHYREFSIHHVMNYKQMEECCATAQYLLRILLNGGYKIIFNATYEQNILEKSFEVNGVILTPPKLICDTSLKEQSLSNEVNKIGAGKE